MSNYTQIIRQLLQRQYPDKTCTSIVISTLNLKFIPAKAQILLQSYSQLKSLTLTNCDLRKLENFPVLAQLEELDLSKNSLQGTFNYLMPLKALSYLNIAGNLISDYRVLEPLRRIKRLEIFLKDNPFTEATNWKYKLKQYSLIVLKEARSVDCSEEKAEELPRVEQDGLQRQLQLQRKERKVFNFGSFREKMMANLQRTIQQPPPQPAQQNYPQLTIQLDEMNPAQLMPLNDSPFIFENSPFINDLRIQLSNERQLEEGVDYQSDNLDANDSEEDAEEEEEEPDAPYF